MKTSILRWCSFVAATLSATWVLLLAALVIRCKFTDPPFPVLAKFSPFRDHLAATDRMLTAFPVLALLAAVLIGIAWVRERNFRAVRAFIVSDGLCLLASLLVITLNPGGYFSWFLS